MKITGSGATSDPIRLVDDADRLVDYDQMVIDGDIITANLIGQVDWPDGLAAPAHVARTVRWRVRLRRQVDGTVRVEDASDGQAERGGGGRAAAAGA